jgi:hypothetical protein
MRDPPCQSRSPTTSRAEQAPSRSAAAASRSNLGIRSRAPRTICLPLFDLLRLTIGIGVMQVIMNLSGLQQLGKVAGIGGISIGAVVLLLYALIGTIPGLPADQQADVVKFVAILCFGTGVIGIIAWFAIGRPSSRRVSTTGFQSPATAAEGNVNIVYGGGESKDSVASRKPTRAAKAPSNAAAQASGDQSPATVSGGDATVRYGAPTNTRQNTQR